MKFIILLLMLSITNVPTILAQTNQNMSSDCASTIDNTKKSIESSINQSRAILLATNSNVYKSYAANYYPTFNYLYYKWNTNGCNVTLNSVNLLFDFITKSYSTQCGATHVVFIESPYLNSILNVINTGTTSPAYCPLVPSNSNHNVNPIDVQNRTNVIHSPLLQFQSGIAANDIKCANNLQLVLKSEDGSPACVSPNTSKILIERGWARPS